MNPITRDDHTLPALDPIQDLMTAPPADWAWEFLRRNPEYQQEAGTRMSPELVGVLPNAAKIFSTLDADARADTWGLCSFRRCNTGV
jgi:Family of unknown function (DUF6499)